MSVGAKFVPSTVSDAPPVAHRFGWVIFCTIAESNVKVNALVPICVLTVTTALSAEPAPEGRSHSADVEVTHETDLHAVLPIEAETVRSTVAKFMPWSVMLSTPAVGPFVAAKLATGAS
jgi:hypothetical protein